MNEYTKIIPTKEKYKILSIIINKGKKLLISKCDKKIVDVWYTYLKYSLKCFIPEYYLSFEFMKLEWEKQTCEEQLKRSTEWLIEILKDIE